MARVTCAGLTTRAPRSTDGSGRDLIDRRLNSCVIVRRYNDPLKRWALLHADRSYVPESKPFRPRHECYTTFMY